MHLFIRFFLERRGTLLSHLTQQLASCLSPTKRFAGNCVQVRTRVGTCVHINLRGSEFSMLAEGYS